MYAVMSQLQYMKMRNVNIANVIERILVPRQLAECSPICTMKRRIMAIQLMIVPFLGSSFYQRRLSCNLRELINLLYHIDQRNSRTSASHLIKHINEIFTSCSFASLFVVEMTRPNVERKIKNIAHWTTPKTLTQTHIFIVLPLGKADMSVMGVRERGIGQSIAEVLFEECKSYSAWKILDISQMSNKSANLFRSKWIWQFPC